MDETSVCKIKEQILRDGRREGFEISLCVLDSVCVDVSTKIKKNIS